MSALINFLFLTGTVLPPVVVALGLMWVTWPQGVASAATSQGHAHAH